ncbi:MAG: nucleotidyltransferase family protein [Anaerolineae bacterium]|nr:nucleotidyltransferase family protein [Anaerolineae bacterium]
MMDAVIMAGSDPGRDAELLACAGNAPVKALIQHEGKTFLEYVAAALLGTGRIGQVVVVGLPEAHRPDLGPQITYLPGAGGMVANAQRGIAHLASAGHRAERIVLSSADIPLLTPGIVNDFVDQCAPYDVDYCYAVVRQEVMERAYPGSGRTFVRLVEGRFAGGDLGVLKPSVLNVRHDVLSEVIGQRKTFWKQIRAVGLDTLFLLLIRRLSIAHLERRCQTALGISGKAVICPHGEVAMDVDKPHHLRLVLAALSRLGGEGS